MKILVCISNVPDTTTKVKFVEGNTKLDTSGIQWVINPWDELSLTRALELKDDAATGVKSVTVAHVGLPASEPTIRKALAIGADDAIRVNAEPADAYFVAAQLAEVVKKEQFDLVMCGIESSDFNGSNVGGMLSEFLEIPSVSAVSSIKFEGGKTVIIREIDGGKESVSVPTPCVVVVQKGIAKEPRIAAMRGIMTARTKPVKVYEPVAVDQLTRVLVFEKPSQRAACKYVDADNPKQLIELLQNEAKVI
jgi:electron transfer flavoprotein beta subunit